MTWRRVGPCMHSRKFGVRSVGESWTTRRLASRAKFGQLGGSACDKGGERGFDAPIVCYEFLCARRQKNELLSPNNNLFRNFPPRFTGGPPTRQGLCAKSRPGAGCSSLPLHRLCRAAALCRAERNVSRAGTAAPSASLLRQGSFLYSPRETASGPKCCRLFFVVAGHSRITSLKCVEAALSAGT